MDVFHGWHMERFMRSQVYEDIVSQKINIITMRTFEQHTLSQVKNDNT